MDTKALTRATLIGLVLQLAMVVGGHFADKVVQAWLFMVGGMGFSLIAGLVYARMARGAWATTLSGGVIAGAVCAAIGILVSIMLRDVPQAVLIFGTLSSAATGMLGAVIGRLVPRGQAAG